MQFIYFDCKTTGPLGLVLVVVVYLMSTLSPLQVECISHESNAWWKICVYSPDLKLEGSRVHEGYP